MACGVDSLVVDAQLAFYFLHEVANEADIIDCLLLRDPSAQFDIPRAAFAIAFEGAVWLEHDEALAIGELTPLGAF